MAEFKVGRSVEGVGEKHPAAIGLDRVLTNRDFILQGKLEGRVFYVQQGNAGTKVDFVETAYDEDQPQFALIVPTGHVCIPLALNVTIEDLAGTENHLIWGKTDNDIGIGTDSTKLTPVNYRRDSLRAPSCSARSLYTNNATMTTVVEIHRFFHPFASNAVTDAPLHRHEWTIDDPDMPILYGPATIFFHLYGTGDGPHGFGEYTWMEFLAGELGL